MWCLSPSAGPIGDSLAEQLPSKLADALVSPAVAGEGGGVEEIIEGLRPHPDAQKHQDHLLGSLWPEACL